MIGEKSASTYGDTVPYWTDGRTDGQTDGQMDGQTDRKSPNDYSNPPPTLCGEG